MSTQVHDVVLHEKNATLESANYLSQIQKRFTHVNRSMETGHFEMRSTHPYV